MPKNQSTLSSVGIFPKLTRPGDAIGETITVPGSYWPWKNKDLALQNAEKLFECTIMGFDAMHRPDNGIPSASFQLQDPDIEEDGSHTQFWMAYPSPFLQYWYKSHAMPGAAMSDSDDEPDAPSGAPAEGGNAPTQPQQRAGVYDFLEFVRDEKVASGKMKGATRRIYQCQATHNGIKCRKEVSVIGKTTSNAVYHFRSCAKGGCEGHAAALSQIEETNPRTVSIDGNSVPVMSFKEAFRHHCDFYWMVADGCPQQLAKRQSFKDYAHGFEPRAVQPHHVTTYRIGTCIDELQDEMQEKHVKAHCAEFDGEPSCGVQLDLWQDDSTKVTYGSLTLTRTLENEQAQLELQSELLEFEEFPYTAHTAVNIANWIQATLRKKNLPLSVLTGITPDGASDGVAAIKSIDQLAELLDICLLHQTNRTLLYAMGLTGRPCRNEAAREVIRENRKVVALSNQSRHVNDGIIKVQKKAGVPDHKVLHTVDTCPTRWGNQHDQMTRNITIKAAIEPTVSKHKCSNKEDKVVVFGCGDDSRTPKEEVSVSEVGMSEVKWQETLELEAATRRPRVMTEMIEKNNKVTGAQGLHMIRQWQSSLHAPLQLYAAPKSAKLKHRARKPLPLLARDDCSAATKQFQDVAYDQVEERHFTKMPSR